LYIIKHHKFIKPIYLEDIKNQYKEFVLPKFYRYIKEKPIYYLLESRLVE